MSKATLPAKARSVGGFFIICFFGFFAMSILAFIVVGPYSWEYVIISGLTILCFGIVVGMMICAIIIGEVGIEIEKTDSP